MALSGDVATIPVAELLAWLAHKRASGTLSLSRGMVAWRFQLRAGRVELASSAARGTMLGRLLIERGLIDEAQLARALAQGRRTRSRLGKTLVQSGLVSAAELENVLTAKTEGLLEEALGWTEGRFFFDDEAVPRRRPALVTAIDLETVVRRAASDPVTVGDADVLEVREIAPPGRAA